MAPRKPVVAPRRPPPANPAAAAAFIRGEAPAVPATAPVPAIHDHPQPSVDGPPAPARRAPAGTAVLVERRGRTRRKLQVYLDPATAAQLVDRCRAEGREISAVVDEAVRVWLAGRAARAASDV